MPQKPTIVGPKTVIDGDRPMRAINDTHPSTWKFPSVVPAERLGDFFDSDEEDEALFAQLQMERKLYRALNGCETRTELSSQVATILANMGFNDYTFMRLDPLDSPDGDQGLIPRVILSNHSGEEIDASSMILYATADNTRTRHLSMLYHFIASLSANGMGHRGGRFVLIVSAGDCGCYITHSGLPKSSRFLSVTPLADGCDEDDFHQHVSANQQALDLLVNTIEGVGIRKFPDCFEANDNPTTAKINPRPLRLLNTLAKKDVTLRQAADLLHLSTDTINKHVAAAKTALGTSTIAGTVWKAVKEGLIDERG